MRLLIKAKPYQGEYDLDVEFTTREWGWIKRLTGYMPLTIQDGFGDPEVLCVFAAIALRRAGRIDKNEVVTVYERLIDDPAFENIDVEQEPDEGDAGPPAPSSNSSTSISGDASPVSSASSETIQNGTGTPASDTSPSDQPTLVT